LELEPYTPVDAPFHRRGAVKPAFVRKQWVLRWPGTVTGRPPEVHIPSPIVRQWPNCEELSDSILPGGRTIENILMQDLIPKENTPEAVAYFLAINHKMYHPQKGVQYDVAGLPAKIVQEVVDAVFAFDQDALAALRYLKWLAEGHRYFPLFRSFDTNVREQLMGVAEKAAQLFFYLAFDYQYDPETKWYARDRKWFDRCATYLHWVGRTGQGLYRSHAGLDPQHDTALGERWPDMKAVFESLDKWDLWKMRQYQHEDGASSEAEEGEIKS